MVRKNIPISFVTALGTVMLPHMSKTNDKEYERKIREWVITGAAKEVYEIVILIGDHIKRWKGYDKEALNAYYELYFWVTYKKINIKK